MMLLVWNEYRSIPLLKTVWTKPSPIYDALPTHTSNVLLELPLVQPDISIEPIFMYFSTFHWNKMVNGYSGFSPPSYQILHDVLETFPDEVSLATLRKRGTTHVIVHGAFMREGDVRGARVPHGQLRGSSVRDGDAVAPGHYPPLPAPLRYASADHS